MTLLFIWFCLLIVIGPPLYALCKVAADADRQADDMYMRMMENRKRENEEHSA